ncbi:Pkinase-domain-containing protein [Conidiobolus coronatus NRRL 28638]|uniref:non-specific serine/threonine protein kinase n=1 Tax=Conidiobolus coronatus (strain ATCC 28846 / CBS 209.66 / NRRL 28638) TaxID=796925 RepID=A0A137NVW1_CONC2|nr:Pkinase-domain-containing protein [Conidiobolus coronatus NRRL 28638]|eukprot:KXN66960.1 Pkinase-domain-containing protein [Conidiobolus coronatus NRRL 28638]
MSWKLGSKKKDKSEGGNSSFEVTSPPPSNAELLSSSKSDLLLLRLVEAKDLNLSSKKGGKGSSYYRGLPYVVAEFDKNEIVIDALGGDLDNPVWKYRAHFDVSRESDLTLSLYIRTVQDGNIDPRNSAHSEFLGCIKITPEFGHQRLCDDWYPITSNGTIRIQTCFKAQADAELSIQDFDLLKVIGKGSFGKVMQVRKRDTNRIYAMKILNKSKIVSRSEVTHTLAERIVLAKINHPFIVPLKYSFQTPEKLYLVLAFVNGGELFYHLQQEHRFDENRARFYTAELLTALECLHGYNIIYRDLKPENILLDCNGHISLCDFGLCKLNMSENDTTNTFCGTPEYLAPELLYGQGYTKAVDWWTLGVLLYEMLTGLPPFYSENTNEMYRRILEDELVFPDDMSVRARSLLRGLLNRDPSQRLGSKGAQDIKSHPFFAEIDWGKLLAKRYQPPFKPNVASSSDTSNFDEEFTNELPQDSVTNDSHLSETVQRQFEGFTFDGDGGVMSLVGSMDRLNV